jgi:hypothetical protein
MSLRSLVAIAVPIVAGAGVAAAQPPVVIGEQEVTPSAFTPGRLFVEVTGDWVLQFGVQANASGAAARKQPLADGFGGGATAGVAITREIELLVDWAHADARSRSGEVIGSLTSVDGDISYDTITGGARMARRLGPGRVYGQLAAGVILPFHTTVIYEYAPSLASVGISGAGSQRDHYGTGVGAVGEFGYHLPLASGIYVGASLRLQRFELSNDGQTTELDNFVTDLSNPRPLTGEVHHNASSASGPASYSVQDARLHIAVGYEF